MPRTIESIETMPVPGQETLDQATFEQFRRLIYQQCGIALREGKMVMLASRIRRRLKARNLTSFRQYLEFLRQDDGSELVLLLDAVSTNVTSFFREGHHFHLLFDELKKLADQKQHKFRIWSAASSTGQEPYTIAMTLCEAVGHVSGLDAKILATDLSTQVLEKASAGIYRIPDMTGIPPALKPKYFRKVSSDSMGVTPELRQLLSFHRMNLMETPYPMRGPFDVVFCRNVMIYFDQSGRQRVLGEIRRLLRPQGLLMLGHAESLQGDMAQGYDRVGNSCYRKA